MDIDVHFMGRTLPIKLSDPHRMDTTAVVGEIEAFLNGDAGSPDAMHLAELLPRMVRGVAGCEGGCPSNAKSLVRVGFRDYHLDYVEGGILTAAREVAPGQRLEIKIFPEF
jgi:hypothetical protein